MLTKDCDELSSGLILRHKSLPTDYDSKNLMTSVDLMVENILARSKEASYTRRSWPTDHDSGISFYHDPHPSKCVYFVGTVLRVRADALR